MKLGALKRVRVVVALAFLVPTFLLFLDFTNSIPSSVAGGVLFPQFIPSLLKFLRVLGVSAVGFLVVSALTLIVGRVYCSSVCPLGTLQDMFSYAARKWNRKKVYRLDVPRTTLRYAMLVLTVASAIAGGGILLTLLDPFSSFGRISAMVVSPTTTRVA